MPWGNDPVASGWGKDPVAKPKPKPKGMLDTALASIGGISDTIGAEVGASVDRLSADAQTAYGPGPSRGPGQPGGPRAFAADRLGSDIIDVPLSFPRGVLRGMGLSEKDANFGVIFGTQLLGTMAARAPLTAGTQAVTPKPNLVAGIIPPKAGAPVGLLAARVAKFDRANVRPTLAAVGPEGSAQLAKFSAENPIVGAAAKRGLQASLDDTGASAGLLAGKYGQAASRATIGETVQEGVSAFANSRKVAGNASAPARTTSFAAKAEALYDRAFGAIPNGVVRPTKTSGVMGDILNRVSAPALADTLQNPMIARLAAATKADAGQITFSDLRALRTWVREAKKNPDLRQNISAADLSRLEGALTEDIYASASTLNGGSPYPARQLQRADKYYAAGMSRINGALDSVFKARSGESAYDGLIGAASDGGRADIQKLLSVKRSLQPREWGDVAATALNRLGKPTAGAAAVGDDAFSVSTFVSNYNRLSPEGREVLFGARGGGGAKASALRAELDNLAEVANMQKTVERASNTSNTAVAGQAAGTAVGIVTQPVATLTALAGIRGLGAVMTDPRFVRWMVGAAKAQTPAQQAAAIQTLNQLAKGSPAIAAVAPMIQQRLQSPAIAEQPKDYAP